LLCCCLLASNWQAKLIKPRRWLLLLLLWV
jgi:hypothetical protein